MTSTSSLRGLAPLVQVGARQIGHGRPGANTRRLAGACADLVARECS